MKALFMNKLKEKWREPFLRAMPVLLWIMAAVIAYDFLLQGWRKFDPNGWWAPAFKKWGYPIWFMMLIGVIEVMGALLLLIPKVRHLGAVMLIIVLIGALITRCIHGVSLEEILFFVNTIVILCLMVGVGYKQPLKSQ